MMNRIIISDIFGRTPELESLAFAVSSTKEPVIIDPYEGRDQGFQTESEAYAFFMQNIGLESYIRKVENWFKKRSEPALIIGFSAGASALWGAAESPVINESSRAVCFYGSQIRHMPGLVPNIHTSLFFPVKEEHFDVSRLKRQLAEKKNVHVHQTPYLHGFMNARSVNFSPAGYAEYVKQLRRL